MNKMRLVMVAALIAALVAFDGWWLLVDKEADCNRSCTDKHSAPVSTVRRPTARNLTQEVIDDCRIWCSPDYLDMPCHKSVAMCKGSGSLGHIRTLYDNSPSTPGLAILHMTVMLGIGLVLKLPEEAFDDMGKD